MKEIINHFARDHILGLRFNVVQNTLGEFAVSFQQIYK